jgi:hypothetical protein
MKCLDCEYESHCFWLLRKTNTLFPDSCKQGRRKRVYQIPKTLKEIIDEKSRTDITVEKVLPV